MATQGLDNSNLFANLMMSFLGGQMSQDSAGQKDGTQTNTGTNSQTGSTTTSGSTTTTSHADISKLLEIYAKKSAGVTPEMTDAIFKEGSKEIPGLTTQFANAAGGRTDMNSALADSMGDLNSRITGKVLDLNNQMQTEAGQIAAQIADLTKSTTSDTNNKTIQDLLNTINGTTTNNSTSKDSIDQNTSIDSQKLMQMLLGGQLLGGLDGLLGGGDGKDGGGWLSGLLGGGGGGGISKYASGGIGDWLQGLFASDSGVDAAGHGFSDVLANQDWGNWSGSDWSSLFSDTGSGGVTDWGSGFDWGGSSDWWSTIGDLWGGA